MAKAGRTLLPLTAEDSAVILQGAAQAADPVTAKQVASQVVCSRAVKEAEVAEVLDRAVSDRGLFRLAPKTAKGKPRYWGHDPEEVLASQLRATLQSAGAPLTAKELLKIVSSAFPTSVAEITRHLEILSASGDFFLIPAGTAKGLPGFWNRSPRDWGRVLIRKKLESTGGQTAEQLAKVARFLSVQEITVLTEEMVTQRELYRHPPLGKVKKILLSLSPPRPELYLQQVAEQLKQVVTALRKERVPEDQLRRSVLQLVGDAGISYGAGGDQAPLRSPAPTVDFEQLIRTLDPGADRGALVGIRDLRRLAAVSKEDFDTSILELSRQGRLSLHRHDFPASLSDQERDDLVVDRQGTYYVGVALRQNRTANGGSDHL